MVILYFNIFYLFNFQNIKLRLIGDQQRLFL